MDRNEGLKFARKHAMLFIGKQLGVVGLISSLQKTEKKIVKFQLVPMILFILYLKVTAVI